MIGIVDYGSGNVRAITNIYRELEIACRVVRAPADASGIDRLVLPGVGAFDQAVRDLDRSGLRATLDRLVLQERMPVLGICVGMQLLADRSDEGELSGLGWVPGAVRRFRPPTDGRRLGLPHMGWNDTETSGDSDLFAGLSLNAGFYFLHSYYFEAASDADVLSWTNYGIRFASAVRRDNVTGVQFHPEKSHEDGMRLLRNFATN